VCSSDLEGFDIVYAIREKRPDPLLKKITSWMFLRVLRGMANVDIDLESGIFRIMSRRCVQGMKSMREKSRFLTGLMNWLGYAKAGVATERHDRYAGSSKYTLFKLIKLAWHGITSFSHYPLQLSTYFGFTAAFLSFVYSIYLIMRKLFFDIPVPGYTSIMVSLFFLGGIILLVLGIIGEYIARIYEEVQNRPLYLVREDLDS
jgi:polyisoprenyl-phosphate glycosyltransferase